MPGVHGVFLSPAGRVASRRLLAVLGTLVIGSNCLAQWTDQPDLPDWAQRGTLCWCLHYTTADRELVDLFADGGHTLIHGGRFDSGETGAYAERLGLRYMPYVCSRTLRTSEMERHPRLKQAVMLKADRAEFLAYNNPARRYGSLHPDTWPMHVRDRVQRVRGNPNVWAVFFDNAFAPFDDHRAENVAAWQAWAHERDIDPGNDVPEIYGSEKAAQSRAFSRDTLIEYHRALRGYCHAQDRPLLNCPNAGSAYGLAALEAGAIDLMFYENSRHPPFYHNGYLYKMGLAAGHGRPTAMLSYIPASVGAKRGVRTWNEGMHHFFYPSSPHPEEFALAIAEAASVGGNYVTCYNLFPALPITDTSDPFNQRIYREIKQSNGFLSVNKVLYTGNQPGGNVAVLYSADTAIQGRRLSNMDALCEAITRAGIPFEIVVPSDLREGGYMVHAQTLVLPNVLYADEETAAGVLNFVKRGGKAIITGGFALYDENGIPRQAASARKLTAALGLVNRSIPEWDLNGFVPEGTNRVKATRDGSTASLVFEDQPGQYTAYIGMTDENDGTSTFELAVGPEVVYEGILDVEDNKLRWMCVPPFALAPRDVVTLTAHPDGGEQCRVTAVILARAGDNGAAVGHGRIVFWPAGIETLQAPALLDLLAPAARLRDPRDVMINIMDLPKLDLTTVHLVNYGLEYEVTVPGLYASDDGSGEARMFFGDRPVAVRKRVSIPDPAGVADPVVQVHGVSVGKAEARLVITVNGKRAATIAHADMAGRGWVDAAIDRDLLTTETVIGIRAEGELNGTGKWIQIDIDTDADGGNSEFSTDRGLTFSAHDLSTDLKAQTGEYMIRIKDRCPGNPGNEPENLVRNPGFEQTYVPHSETTITVVPAENASVELIGRPRACLAISPNQPPYWIEGAAAAEGTSRYIVPRVDCYTVLVLADKRARIEPIRQANQNAAIWTLPRVTEPLRGNTIGWKNYGKGFSRALPGGRADGSAITCQNAADTDIRGAVQQFTFAAGDQPDRMTITAWSRCEHVSGVRNADYSVYVDAVCADGTVFNGHSASFDVGSHDWQQTTLVLEPPVPIRTMRLYLLFRRHSGQAWFDDVRIVRD